jgi:hypothetical protein
MSFAQFLTTLESHSTDDPVVHEASNTAVDVSLSTDTTDAVTEMDEHMRSIDQVDTGIESAEVAIDRIAELQSTVSDKLQHTGSLTDFEQKAAEITHESIMSSLGLPAVKLTNESTSYDQRASSLIATLEDQSQSLWQKIVAGVKRALEMVLVFIQDLVRNNFLLKRYWSKTMEQVKKVSGQTPSKEMMTDSAKALSVPESVTNDPKDVEKRLQLMAATAMGMMRVSDISIDEINRINFKLGKLENDRLTDVMQFGKEGIPPVRTAEGEAYGFLTGGRSIVRASGVFIDRAYEKMIVSGAETTEIAVGTPEVMNDAMGLADKIMDAIRKFDSKRSYVKNILSRVQQFLVQDVMSLPAMVNKSMADARHEINKIRGLRSVLNSVIGRFPLESFKIAKAFIDYCRNSLKYYNTASA